MGGTLAQHEGLERAFTLAARVHKDSDVFGLDGAF